MLTSRLKCAFAFLALVGLVAVPAFGEEPPQTTMQTNPSPQTGTPAGAAVPAAGNLTCESAGGGELSNLKVTNKGATKVPKGTRLEYSTTSPKLTGMVTLPSDLLPGGSHTFNTVTIATGAACTLKVKPSLMNPAAAAQTATVKPVIRTLKCAAGFGATLNEASTSLSITNNGSTALPKGTLIHWEIPPGGVKGDYTLTADLAPKHAVWLDGVLPSTAGISVQTPCIALKK